MVSGHFKLQTCLFTFQVNCSGFFRPGQLGVAIGRAVNKEGLQVVGYSEEVAKLQHPPEVQEFYETREVPASQYCCFQAPEPSPPAQPSTQPEELEHTSDPLQRAEPTAELEHASDSLQPAELNPEIPPGEKITFPWNISNFVDNLARFPSAGFPDYELAQVPKARLQKFLDASYAACKSIIDQSKERASSGQPAIHVYVRSPALHEQTQELFSCSTSLTSAQCRIGTAIVMGCYRRLCREMAGEIQRQQQLKQSKVEAPAIDDLSPQLKAKIRYIAGACMAKVKTKLQASISTKLFNATPQAKVTRERLHAMVNKLNAMRPLEATIMDESEDQASLDEVNFRQGPSRGLTHVSDHVFSFYLHLYRAVQPFTSVQGIHANLSQTLSAARASLQSNAELCLLWEQLFVAEEKNEADENNQDEEEPLDPDDMQSEILSGMLYELYCMVTEHYLRIALYEGLQTFKSTIPKKRKQALRSQLKGMESLKGKPRSSRSTCIPAASSSSTNAQSSTTSHYCGLCNKECVDNPSTDAEQCIQCDGCDKWVHFSCAGLDGSESCLTSDEDWFCQKCQPEKSSKHAKRKRRGRK